MVAQDGMGCFHTALIEADDMLSVASVLSCLVLSCLVLVEEGGTTRNQCAGLITLRDGQWRVNGRGLC
jgi:hypothetical protein